MCVLHVIMTENKHRNNKLKGMEVTRIFFM